MVINSPKRLIERSKSKTRLLASLRNWEPEGTEDTRHSANVSLLALSGNQLSPRDTSATRHKADLRERRTDVAE
jgi:hypothetical protein